MQTNSLVLAFGIALGAGQPARAVGKPAGGLPGGGEERPGHSRGRGTPDGGAGSQAPCARPAPAAIDRRRQAYTQNTDTEGIQRQFAGGEPDTGETSVARVRRSRTKRTPAGTGIDAQITQTIFRWDQWQRLKQADSRVALAEANYRAAQQDLMVRVAQRYFDVLARRHARRAEATLEAVNRQLEQAEKRSKSG
jgi:outer membrane protein TolC